VTADYGRMDLSLPRDTGVRLRMTSDEMHLIATGVPRRWWQLWKPRFGERVLESAPSRVQAGDTVQLTQRGQCYAVTVNDTIVLRWPPEEPDD
jgi:hypothetical protein